MSRAKIQDQRNSTNPAAKDFDKKRTSTKNTIHLITRRHSVTTLHWADFYTRSIHRLHYNFCQEKKDIPVLFFTLIGIQIQIDLHFGLHVPQRQWEIRHRYVHRREPFVVVDVDSAHSIRKELSFPVSHPDPWSSFDCLFCSK